MKKNKEAAQPQLSYAVRVRKQRSKKNSMVIDCVKRPDTRRSLIKTRPCDYSPVNFTIIIDKDEFEKLYDYVHNHDDFRSQFSDILRDAFRKLWEKKTRGNHKSHESSITWIKQRASFLHTLFSFINDSEVKPEYFNKLMEKIPIDKKIIHQKRERV